MIDELDLAFDNATLTVHVPPAATEAARQVLPVMLKPAPEIDRPETVSGPLPVLRTVTVCDADTVFVVTLPNDRPVALPGTTRHESPRPPSSEVRANVV